MSKRVWRLLLDGAGAGPPPRSRERMSFDSVKLTTSQIQWTISEPNDTRTDPTLLASVLLSLACSTLLALFSALYSLRARQEVTSSLQSVTSTQVLRASRRAAILGARNAAQHTLTVSQESRRPR